jgi:hypothetical protein
MDNLITPEIEQELRERVEEVYKQGFAQVIRAIIIMNSGFNMPVDVWKARAERLNTLAEEYVGNNGRFLE